AALRPRLGDPLGPSPAAIPPPGGAVDADLGAGVRLTDEQLTAVRAALGHPLALVAGGPGTGKTSMVVALLRALVRTGVAPEEIALAAPTGRAARRLEQAVRTTLAALAPAAQAA